jgi:hypothetical protein
MQLGYCFAELPGPFQYARTRVSDTFTLESGYPMSYRLEVCSGDPTVVSYKYACKSADAHGRALRLRPG